MARATNGGQDGVPDGSVLHLNARRRAERHVLLGVSHPSNDPARHRTFEIRASYDAAAKGWMARVGEQNLNEQRGGWSPLGLDEDQRSVFPSAAACLGHAVSCIVASVDQEAGAAS